METEERPMEDQTVKGSSVTLDFENLQLSAESLEGRLKDMKPALSKLLQSMRDGARGLAESRAEDARLSRELCGALSAYTSWLDVALEIPPETIPTLHNAERMFLSPQGDLVVVDGRGKVNSQALAEYPTEIVLTVVCNALPKLQSKIDSYSHRLTERIELLGRVNEDLRSLPTFAEEKPKKT